MFDNKKEYERAELHKTIWNIADDLRGSVDGWDFKNYVLGMLFYRYISENFQNYVNEKQRAAGLIDFDYANFSDEEAKSAYDFLVGDKGFFIFPSQLFCNLRKRAPEDENLNETLANIFKEIESSSYGRESEKNFRGLFNDFDTNSNK